MEVVQPATAEMTQQVPGAARITPSVKKGNINIPPRAPVELLSTKVNRHWNWTSQTKELALLELPLAFFGKYYWNATRNLISV